MNFEQLFYKLIAKTTDNKKKISYFNSMMKIKNFHKQQLKLGSLVFEIKEFIVANFKIYEVIEIRFTKQDNTREDLLRIDTRLNALKWKWNFANILSLFIILFFLFFFIYAQIDYWYYENFSLSEIDNNKYNNILKYSFDSFFLNNIHKSNVFSTINLWFSNTLFDLCNYYNILK